MSDEKSRQQTVRLVHLEPCASCPDHPRSRYPMTMEATPEQIVMFLMGTKQPTV